jgi:hypothetical protein
MVSRKQRLRALRFARSVVAAQFDTSRGQEILTAMQGQYKLLAPTIPPLTSRINRILLQIAVDTLAIYRALPSTISPEQRLDAAQAFVNTWMDGQFDRWIARKVYANHVLHRLYRRWWFRSANRADEAAGWHYEYLPPANDVYYGVNVLRCGIVTYLAVQGAPELAPILCRGDLHIRRYLPKGVVLRRTQVIAEGADSCDFRYVITSD